MPMRWGCKLIQPLWKTEWRLFIVQETVTKTIPKKKKCNKAKWLRKPYKRLREEKPKAKEKRKDIPI